MFIFYAILFLALTISCQQEKEYCFYICGCYANGTTNIKQFKGIMDCFTCEIASLKCNSYYESVGCNMTDKKTKILLNNCYHNTSVFDWSAPNGYVFNSFSLHIDNHTDCCAPRDVLKIESTIETSNSTSLSFAYTCKNGENRIDTATISNGQLYAITDQRKDIFVFITSEEVLWSNSDSSCWEAAIFNTYNPLTPLFVILYILGALSLLGIVALLIIYFLVPYYIKLKNSQENISLKSQPVVYSGDFPLEGVKSHQRV